MATLHGTYYFNQSTETYDDPDSVWTNENNAFDGSTSTYAACSTTGSTSSNYLFAGGTDAPTSGSEYINKVEARVYGASSSAKAAIYTDGLGELLGTAASGTLAYGALVTLTEPSGGWTWAKIAALEVKLYCEGLASDVHRVEVKVWDSRVINNFWGAETGGLEECSSTSGSPSNQVSAAHSGGRGYYLQGSSDVITFDALESVAEAGSNYCIGFWIKVTSLNGANDPFLRIKDSSGSQHIAVGHSASGQLLLYDSSDTSIGSSTATMSAATWHFVELYFEKSNSGDCAIYLDDTLEASPTNDDLYSGSTGLTLEFAGSSVQTTLIDDIYAMSDCYSSTDRLGGCEVYYYKTAETGAAPDSGDTLDEGNWGNVQEVPFSESNVAAYTDSTAQSGTNLTDHSTGGGPSGDSNITGSLLAHKVIIRAKRSGGGGTEQYVGIGYYDAGYNVTSSADLDVTTDFVNYFLVTESNVPTSSLYGVFRVNKSSGGQDYDFSDVAYTIMHVPATAGTGIVYDHRRHFRNLLTR